MNAGLAHGTVSEPGFGRWRAHPDGFRQRRTLPIGFTATQRSRSAVEGQEQRGWHRSPRGRCFGHSVAAGGTRLRISGPYTARIGGAGLR